MHPQAASPRALARSAVVALLLGLLAGLVPVASPLTSLAAAAEYDDVIDITFPTDPAKVTFADWYDAPRSGGRVHKATDIMGPKLLPIYAAMGGTVTRMTTSSLSGYYLSIAGDDGRSYGYVHLNNDTPGTDDGKGTLAHAYAPGVELGARVERGQHIAFMGDSGNAEATAPHLHFSISDPDVVDPYGTTYLNPYPSLKAAIARGDVPTATAHPVGSAPPPPTPPAPPDLTPACGAAPTTEPFEDVTSANVHHRAVECLARHEITYGFGDGRYGPSGTVTRLQMAAFVTRMLEHGGVALPASPSDAYDDDDGNLHELAVNQLVALGVIRGDTGEVGRTFYGSVAMKRDRMASWMARAHDLMADTPLPESDTDWFTDDSTTRSAGNEADINRLAAAGIVQGTKPGTYQPDAGVRRDQMASYLARTLAAAIG